MGYNDLLSIICEASEEVRDEESRIPTACPECGTPLEEGLNGILHCRFDGWKFLG